MSYIGNSPIISAFPADPFSGNGSTTAFTLSVAPANTNSIIVVVSGILQDPTTYSVNGTTLTFSAAPPSGTNNISVRYLGIPASGVVNTAFYARNDYTATAGQTTFSVPSYTVPFIQVLRNGVTLGTADYTATSGTSVVLANAATAGDLITVISFFVSSVANAIPNTANAVSTTNLNDGSVTAAKMASNGAWAPAGTVIQVVSSPFTTSVSTTSASFVAVSGFSASITPKFSTSKILVLITAHTQSTTTNSNFTIYRNGSTNLGDATTGFGYFTGGGGNINIMASFSYLDSPATTSSTSYALYYKTGGGQTLAVNNGAAVSSITLMEIAA